MLTSKEWLGKNTEGIYLKPGFYKIDYVLSGTTNIGSGLALFEPESKQFRQLITWHTYIPEDSAKIIHFESAQLIDVKTDGVVAITNHKGNY